MDGLSSYFYRFNLKDPELTDYAKTLDQTQTQVRGDDDIMRVCAASEGRRENIKPTLKTGEELGQTGFKLSSIHEPFYQFNQASPDSEYQFTHLRDFNFEDTKRPQDPQLNIKLFARRLQMGAIQFKLLLNDYGERLSERIKPFFNQFTEFIANKHWADLTYSLKNQSDSDDDKSPKSYNDLIKLAQDPIRVIFLDCPAKQYFNSKN